MQSTYITQQYFQRAKKFYTQNPLEDISSGSTDFMTKYNKIKGSQSQSIGIARTTRNSQSDIQQTVLQYTVPSNSQYKPLFSVQKEDGIVSTHSKRMPTCNSQAYSISKISPFTLVQQTLSTRLDTDNKQTTKRQPIKKQIIKLQVSRNNDQQPVDIVDHLISLKHKQEQSKYHIDYNAILSQREDNFISLTQLKQIHIKQVKSEHYANLNKLYYCTYALYCIKTLQSINIQDIVNLYLHNSNQKITNQLSQVDAIVEQFLSDMDIATKMFPSDKQMSRALSKITGIEHKIFFLFFKPKISTHTKPQDYHNNENISQYSFYAMDKFDIYLRILGAGDLPLDYQEHLRHLYEQPDYQPNILSNQFKDKDYQSTKLKYENEFGTTKQQWIINASKIDVDIDFIKRLLYYQKNLQIALKQKQTDQISNKKLQMSTYDKKGRPRFNFQRRTTHLLLGDQQGLLYQLENGETQLGTFPHVTRGNRYFFENLDQQEKIIVKAKEDAYIV